MWCSRFVGNVGHVGLGHPKHECYLLPMLCSYCYLDCESKEFSDLLEDVELLQYLHYHVHNPGLSPEAKQHAEWLAYFCWLSVDYMAAREKWLFVDENGVSCEVLPMQERPQIIK